MPPFPSECKAYAFLERIRHEMPRLGLTPGEPPESNWPGELSRLEDKELLGREPADPLMVEALRSGLLLRADCLDASHKLSQKIKTTTGSYWHGIMHRREPDFQNAKYWFRQVGEHPVFTSLAREAPAISERAGTVSAAAQVLEGGRWDSFQFVDLCEACQRGGRSTFREELEELQELEINLLLEYSFRQAIGE